MVILMLRLTEVWWGVRVEQWGAPRVERGKVGSLTLMYLLNLFLLLCFVYQKCDTSKHKVLAVSLCPQSLPYFAAKFSLSVNDAAKRLCGFLKSLGKSGFVTVMELKGKIIWGSCFLSRTACCAVIKPLHNVVQSWVWNAYSVILRTAHQYDTLWF